MWILLHTHYIPTIGLGRTKMIYKHRYVACALTCQKFIGIMRQHQAMYSYTGIRYSCNSSLCTRLNSYKRLPLFVVGSFVLINVPIPNIFLNSLQNYTKKLIYARKCVFFDKKLQFPHPKICTCQNIFVPLHPDLGRYLIFELSRMSSGIVPRLSHIFDLK